MPREDSCELRQRSLLEGERAVQKVAAARIPAASAPGGAGRAPRSQTKAHSTDGMPSMINVICQPTAWIRNPVTAAIHMTVTGLPRIRIALARERSARVNQWVSRMSIDGKMRLSATPSRRRSATSSQ